MRWERLVAVRALLLVLAGLGCLVVAAWMLTPVAGVGCLGVALLLLAYLTDPTGGRTT